MTPLITLFSAKWQKYNTLCLSKLVHSQLFITFPITFSRTHSNLPNMCRKCGESFKTVQELNTHRQTEHYSHYRHQCSQCGCKFKDVSRLMNHVRQSHSGKFIFSWFFSLFIFAKLKKWSDLIKKTSLQLFMISL